MKDLINDIKITINNSNLYTGLFMALALPDICAKLENPENNNIYQRYKDWFEKYLQEYKGYLTGNDCYALRCAVLHEANANITSQRKREILEYVVFTEGGAHKNLFRECILTNGKKQTFLQLNTKDFCEDMVVGVESWLEDVRNNPEIQKRITETIRINPKGFFHYGLQFN